MENSRGCFQSDEPSSVVYHYHWRNLKYDTGVVFDDGLISGLDVSCQGLFYWTKQSSPIRSNRQRRGHTPLQNPVVAPLQTLTGLLGDVGIIWW